MPIILGGTQGDAGHFVDLLPKYATIIKCQDKPGLDIPGLLQHVMIRGIERRDIFADDGDRSAFVDRFSSLLVKTGTDCLAWSRGKIKGTFFTNSHGKIKGTFFTNSH